MSARTFSENRNEILYRISVNRVFNKEYDGSLFPEIEFVLVDIKTNEKTDFMFYANPFRRYCVNLTKSDTGELSFGMSEVIGLNHISDILDRKSKSGFGYQRNVNMTGVCAELITGQLYVALHRMLGNIYGKNCLIDTSREFDLLVDEWSEMVVKFLRKEGEYKNNKY